MAGGRVILHVDLDAFFAACEERDRPEIRGKPVVVGADPKGGRGRGVVATCNYAARARGIRSAMPISLAYKLCPECVFLRPNFELYVTTSERIMKILRAYADKMEVVGIDEAFLDVSGRSGGSFEEAEKLARKIKMEIYAKERLTCSIGVAPNKLVAKIASDFRKPDGLTVVKPHEVTKFLAPLPVRKLWGVGPKTEERLREMGISTIGELAAFDVVRLAEEFGSVGTWLHRAANGIDDSEVVEEWEVKSIGRERTFEKDTLDERVIRPAVEELCGDVAERVVQEGVFFKTVGVKVRFTGFHTVTRAKSLPHPSQSAEALRKTVQELLRPFLSGPNKIRLIGVRVTGLLRVGGQRKLEEFGS
ncbi:MAG: DNA polymerase IV [Candidatus Micrarchaeia archaeon]